MLACLQMLSEVIANFNESLLVEDEQYVLVVDLFIVRSKVNFMCSMITFFAIRNLINMNKI